MFSSPSLPNIAQAVRNNENVKRKSSSDDQSNPLTNQSSHNPLLVQALIANQIGRIQSQSLNRAQSMDSVNQFNNLALMRLMTKDKQHSLHLNQPPPTFGLSSFDIMLKHHQQSEISRSFDVPICNRTLLAYDDTSRVREARLLWESISGKLSTIKFDTIPSRPGFGMIIRFSCHFLVLSLTIPTFFIVTFRKTYCCYFHEY